MIEVEKMWEGLRQEGLNSGLPTTFIKLGSGPGYSSEELAREVLTHTRCKWVCILGKNTTQVGLGSLVKGLSSIGMFLEIEVGGEVRDPGWLHTVDRWVVDFVKDPLFNFGALRGQDMVRFVVQGEGDLNFAREGFEDLRVFPGTRIVKVVVALTKTTGKNPLLLPLYKEAFSLVRKYDRARLYLESL